MLCASPSLEFWGNCDRHPDPSAHEPITNSQYPTANDCFLHASRDFSLVRVPTIKVIALDHRELFQVVAAQRQPTNREANLRQGISTRNLRGAQQFLLHATVSHESLPNEHKLINTALITTDHDWHTSEGEEVDPTHAPEDVLQCVSNVAQRISLQSPHLSSKRLSCGIDCGQLSIGDTIVDTRTLWLDWPAERP